MSNIKEAEVLVIGGGPAGLAAAVSAARSGAKVVILERENKAGGILKQCIHNGFGLKYFNEELTGPEYAERFIDMLEGLPIELYTDTMVLSVNRDRMVTAVSQQLGFVTWHAKAIVLAMGCRERTRGALQIAGDRPAGVFTAGCAQRLVNLEGYMPGREVVILGSGDIGLIMARRFTWEGAKVKLVLEIMPYSSGLNRNIVQCLHDNDIPLLFSHTVVKIHGKDRVEGITYAEVDERRNPIPGTEVYVPCDTLLLSVGLIPENELTEGLNIPMDRVTNGAVVDQNRQTDAEGVFACGNVLHVHDLVDNVSEESMIAGRSAARYALGQSGRGEPIPVKCGEHVRYTVPQKVDPAAQEPGEDLRVYFRTDNVYQNVTVELRSGDTLLARRRRMVVAPGEMENISCKYADIGKISGEISVHIITGGAK